MNTHNGRSRSPPIPSRPLPPGPVPSIAQPHENIAEDQDEDFSQIKHTPHILHIRNLVKKEPISLLSNVRLFGKKSRSRSPPQNKQSNILYPKNLDCKIIEKGRLSPQPSRRYEIPATRKEFNNISTGNEINSNNIKPSTAVPKNLKILGNSKKIGFLEDGEATALKAYTREKRRANSELWKAAEEGDLKKLVNVLESYYISLYKILNLEWTQRR